MIVLIQSVYHLADASKRKTLTLPVCLFCNRIKTFSAYPCKIQYYTDAHLLYCLCCDLPFCIYATLKMLHTWQKNFLILTAEEKKPLMGSQDAHVIELISVHKLQQCMNYGKWEPNSAELVKLVWVTDISRGAWSNGNLTHGGPTLSACREQCFNNTSWTHKSFQSLILYWKKLFHP